MKIYFLSLRAVRALDAVPLMVSTESALSVTTDTERKRDNDNSPPEMRNPNSGAPMVRAYIQNDRGADKNSVAAAAISRKTNFQS
jgi:hypothetical protein